MVAHDSFAAPGDIRRAARRWLELDRDRLGEHAARAPGPVRPARCRPDRRRTSGRRRGRRGAARTNAGCSSSRPCGSARCRAGCRMPGARAPRPASCSRLGAASELGIDARRSRRRRIRAGCPGAAVKRVRGTASRRRDRAKYGTSAARVGEAELRVQLQAVGGDRRAASRDRLRAEHDIDAAGIAIDASARWPSRGRPTPARSGVRIEQHLPRRPRPARSSSSHPRTETEHDHDRVARHRARHDEHPLAARTPG